MTASRSTRLPFTRGEEELARAKATGGNAPSPSTVGGVLAARSERTIDARWTSADETRLRGVLAASGSALARIRCVPRKVGTGGAFDGIASALDALVQDFAIDLWARDTKRTALARIEQALAVLAVRRGEDGDELVLEAVAKSADAKRLMAELAHGVPKRFAADTMVFEFRCPEVGVTLHSAWWASDKRVR